MTYQEIADLVAAGFTKNDIALLAQAQARQVIPQPAQMPIAQQAQPAQMPITQQAQPAQMPIAQQAQPAQMPITQQAQPAQMPIAQQAQPAQMPIAQASQTEADMISIIQRLNASQSGMDIPPARTSSDILSDHLMEMFDSKRNDQSANQSNVGTKHQ